ncbi:MAG: hypothetical protein Nk1A_3390 [Endomicrobiia bacterium]|nr:MAG: hypothetical protein Nk1A_3390 [Endomicrobiia bacterium]
MCIKKVLNTSLHPACPIKSYAKSHCIINQQYIYLKVGYLLEILPLSSPIEKGS